MTAKAEKTEALPLDLLTAEVQASAKYRHVCPDLIRRLGAQELRARRSLKEAIKETKNRLHQVAGAYLPGKMRYDDWRAQLTGAHTVSADAFREACRQVMAHHASTRERLPHSATLFQTTLASIAPVHSVLDVACGLNPLALPWMPLAPDARYVACDLYADMMAFLTDFFVCAGIAGHAERHDALTSLPAERVEVAFVLKFLPLLEQVEKGAGLTLLRALPADHVLVSFPTRTLGGRDKNMAAHYDASFSRLIAGEGWRAERFAFENELCFLVRK